MRTVTYIPADSKEALCGNAHDEEGGPGHHNVLQGIPEVREHVHVGLNKRKKYNKIVETLCHSSSIP